MKLAHSLMVSRVTGEGSDAVVLSFEPSPAQLPHFEFLPGQYLTLQGGQPGAEQWRCYSITSAPEPGQPLSVLVRRVAGGLLSNWICDNVRAGTELQVLRPGGRFTLRRPGRSVVLYAGGSGIAPIFALARQALLEDAPKVTLFYANRDRATAMLMAELHDLQGAADGRMEIRLWYDAEHGLPTAPALRAGCEAVPAADVYLCGPEPFMRAVEAALVDAGIDRAAIYREDFSLPDSPEGADAADADPAASLSVALKGQTHVVSVAPRESLLSAMLGSGLAAPHACKVGECASCMCRLEGGEVERLDNAVLDEDDVADGWILACRTRALSERVSIRFP